MKNEKSYHKLMGIGSIIFSLSILAGRFTPENYHWITAISTLAGSMIFTISIILSKKHKNGEQK